MKQLILANEPYIRKVTLPSGTTAAWFYNPETTKIARFAAKVVFRSRKSGMEYVYILLLSKNHIDQSSIIKAWSIADDLRAVNNQTYKPHFSDQIYALDDCEIE